MLVLPHPSSDFDEDRYLCRKILITFSYYDNRLSINEFISTKKNSSRLCPLVPSVSVDDALVPWLALFTGSGMVSILTVFSFYVLQ